MKAILMSIRPQWVAKILNGEKTIEIRKTCPNIFKNLKPYEGASIDVYIYCTKDKKYANLINRGGFLTGMVVAKFTLNKCREWHNYSWQEITNNGCVSDKELQDYSHNKASLYIWHIDNLEIFDKPKELKEFFVYSHSVAGVGLDGKDKTFEILKPLTKAPQSYCFIRDVL